MLEKMQENYSRAVKCGCSNRKTGILFKEDLGQTP